MTIAKSSIIEPPCIFYTNKIKTGKLLSIMLGVEVLKEGIIWRVGNGQGIKR